MATSLCWQSKKIFITRIPGSFKRQNFLKSHLNDGTGEAWAGQDNANGAEAFLVKIKPSVAMENFGLVPPIGSVESSAFRKFLPPE